MIRSKVIASVAALLAAAGAPLVGQGRGPACAPDNAGLTLQGAFCALVVADSVGPARHIVVAPNGDLFMALRGPEGGVLALRDTSGDGVADVRARFGPAGGTGIALHGGFLYFATDDAVVRWRWAAGQLEPQGPPDTVVSQLLSRRQHAAKTIALGADGALYVNIGAPSNACQPPDSTGRDRRPGVRGQDPCVLLDSAGGVWRFDANRLRQTQADGQRFATGLRNVVALAMDASSGRLYGAQHGRDALYQFWPAHYDSVAGAEKPAEELFRLERGKDYGWPYCYFDPELKAKVLAPEYGGDGRTVGRCAAAEKPSIAFPAHWAPNALAFYSATQFPVKYRGGLFIAFHGSWNRAPLPQGGYKVVFVPFARGVPAGQGEVFADGFAGAEMSPTAARHRPTGLAVGPDGSLYITSDQRPGRVFRIMYRP
ncbi:MAG TPA: PQQ-dependent sugar dehydrogenase [Gemmatimonadales bacterium]|jgi:glucose/arabinose dehydrogenase|nr:PQQ-dependent sugar dehydrogenase [Gemmatimonadales bacterium]